MSCVKPLSIFGRGPCFVNSPKRRPPRQNHGLSIPTMMLSVAIGALAFSAPASNLPALRDSKVLALRGGGVDAITTLATLNAASGLHSWIAPKEALAMYGVKKDPSAYETFFMRALAGIQFATAVRAPSRRHPRALCTHLAVR